MASGLLGGLAAVGVFILLRGGDPAVIELVAQGSGAYDRTVEIPTSWVDTSTTTMDGVVRVPLVLGVRNVGGEAATPERLQLSVPLQVRLTGAEGRRLAGRISPGGPLVQYELDALVSEVEPGAEARPLEAADTLWLELVVPQFYCMVMADSVPEFVPAPPMAGEALSNVQIFYSFEGGDLERRNTGLLRVQLDPAVVKREAPEPVPSFTAEVRSPAVPMPAISALRYVGSRRSICGEAARPVEFMSTLWETPNGGRFFVLDYGGVPRKYLFDLNRDSIIELEMWDTDADGRFEARRQAELPIPTFLLPSEPGPVFDPGVLAGLSAEERAGLDVFGRAMRGPYDPRTEPPDSAERLHVFRTRRIEATDESDAERERLAAPDRSSSPRVLGRPAEPRARPPSADPAPPERDRPPRAPEDDARRPPGEPAPEPEPARPEPPAEEEEEVQLLGSPVDSARSTPPDTTGGDD